MIQKIKEFWIGYKSSIPSVAAIVLVFGLIVVIAQQSMAHGKTEDGLSRVSSGYHGLGWKNFGYLKPASHEGTSGYRQRTASSRRFRRDASHYGFSRAGGRGYALSDVFAGGGSGGGGSKQKGLAQLALFNQPDIGTDILTGSSTADNTGAQASLRNPDQNGDFSNQTHAVPEPATIMLFGSGAVAMALRRRTLY